MDNLIKLQNLRSRGYKTIVKSNNLTYNNTKDQSAIPSWYVLTLTNKIIELLKRGFKNKHYFKLELLLIFKIKSKVGNYFSLQRNLINLNTTKNAVGFLKKSWLCGAGTSKYQPNQHLL
jgi:hypothetical protein